jgi:hypothetical protein
MKRRKFVKAAMILMAVMLVVGLALSCDNGTSSKKDDPEKPGPGGSGSKEADLKTFKIGDFEVAAANLPKAIPDGETGSGAEYTATISVADPATMQSPVVTATFSEKATAAYAVGTSTSFASATFGPLGEGNKLDVSLTATGAKYVFIKVTAEDTTTIQYYRFRIEPKNNVATINSLTIGGVTVTTAAPNADPAQAAAATVSLNSTNKNNATVVATATNNKATVAYNKVTGSAAPGEFTAAGGPYNFLDGDTVYIKVTAENGITINYYKVTAEIGRDATLQSLKIGDDSEPAAATALGTPKTTWASFTTAQRGTYQVDDQYVATGFKVAIGATDTDAAVVWTVIKTTDNTGATPPATWDGTANSTVFPLGESDLVIKVTSANNSVTNYYRIRVTTRNFVEVKKGTPSLIDPANAANDKYIDPIWNSVAGDWFDVGRVNKAESYDAWFAEDYGQHTSAKAKVLWDNDGLWLYADVTFKDYRESATGTEKVRIATRSGEAASYTHGTSVTETTFTTPSNAHTYDSVEFFVNERLQTRKTGNYGNQYRVGLPNATDGTIWLSGDSGNMPSEPTFNPITQFQLDGGDTLPRGNVRSWVKTEGAKETGYVIIMRVKWVKSYAADIDKVFNAGNVIPDAEVGMEIQFNACATDGTRNGILTWNGVTGQSYQNVRNYGIAKLVN